MVMCILISHDASKFNGSEKKYETPRFVRAHREGMEQLQLATRKFRSHCRGSCPKIQCLWCRYHQVVEEVGNKQMLGGIPWGTRAWSMDA